MSLSKLISFFNLREHYKNRIKKRQGSHIFFLFSKKIDEKRVSPNSKTKCEVWKYKNHIYFTENNQMQTYVKTVDNSLANKNNLV